MPRKKQGLRSYHHKSRNGCSHCKRRRVKCSMQAPACVNCIRRKEVCEYPGVIDDSHSSVTRPVRFQDGITNIPVCGLDAIFGEFGICMKDCLPSVQSSPGSHTDNIANNATVDSHITLLVKSVLNRSWFTPAETVLWSDALLKNATKYPYLQHCMYSLAYLRRDLRDQPTEGTPVCAYQHQLTASTLFRQGAPVVDAENWIAVVAFHVFMLVFQFSTQSTCTDADFNLVATLRVLRSSNAIEAEAKPFFEKSKFWELILKRTTVESFEVDSALRTSLQALAVVIAELLEHHDNDPDDEERAEINRQAFAELCEWVFSCDAHPRRWNQYCYWPGRVTPEFLDLLDDKDDVALLLIIHWCAVLHRSPKPSVFNWAHRTAGFAIANLSDWQKWENLLVWPLQMFSKPRNNCTYVARLAKDLQLSNTLLPEQAAVLFNLPYSEDTSLAATDAEMNALSPSDLPVPPANSSKTEGMTMNSSAASPSMIFGGAPGPLDDCFATYMPENIDPTLLLSTSSGFDAMTIPALDDFGIPLDPLLLPNAAEDMDVDLFPTSSRSISMESNSIPVQSPLA